MTQVEQQAKAATETIRKEFWANAKEHGGYDLWDIEEGLKLYFSAAPLPATAVQTSRRISCLPQIHVHSGRLLEFEGEVAELIATHAAEQTRLLREWRPIKTAPMGEPIEVYFAHGEKGNGEIAVVYGCDSGHSIGWWTWGGPNSGSDYTEEPVCWRPLRNFPTEAELAGLAAQDKEEG